MDHNLKGRFYWSAVVGLTEHWDQLAQVFFFMFFAHQPGLPATQMLTSTLPALNKYFSFSLLFNIVNQ